MAIANSGAALGEGLNSGADFASKVIGAARGRQQYQQQQHAQQAAGDSAQDTANAVPGASGDPDEAQNAQAHTSFLQSLGQGLSHIGTGINNFFAGAPAAGAHPGAAPASGLPAQPGVAPAPGGAPGAAAYPAGGNPQAAPVGLPQAPGAPTMGVQGGAPSYMQDGGVVPQNSGGIGGVQMTATPSGAVNSAAMTNNATANSGLYMEDGGPVPQTGLPNPGASLGAGLNQGAQVGQAVVNNARAGQQFGQQQSAQKAAGDAVESYAAHLHGAGLDDTNTPNSADPGHPSYSQAQNPQQLLAAVGQDQRAQQGLPEKGNSKAHSITPEWWDESDNKMAHAAAMAAYAGHDPDQVYQSLNHMRTSFVQGHMLRAASAASVALQNGDMKAVEQNLRNMNYYLPDGKDLTVSKDSDGNLTYQNPLQQFVGANGQPTDAAKDPTTGKPNQPNMIPVDQAHIQLLGQAILNPMEVNNTLMGTRAAMAKQRLEAAQTQAQVTNSEARRDIGKARLGEMPAINYKNMSQGDLDRAKAATAGYSLQRWRLLAANQKLDPTALRGAQQASNTVDDVLTPKKSVTPADADKDINVAGAIGRTYRDSSLAPKEFQNIDPLTVGEIKQRAGALYMSNAHTGMTPSQAAQVSLQLHSQGQQSHKGPDGKPYPNAYIHRQQGEAGIWNPQTKQYDKYRIDPQSASTLLDNGGKMPEQALISAGLGGGGGEGGAAGAPTDNEEDFALGNDQNG